MDFSILGPLEVRHAGVPLAIPGMKRRALLIALLAHAGRSVSLLELTRWLWPLGRPPRSATIVIQAHVSSLRRILEPEHPLIRTTPGGYRIQVEPKQLDSARFAAMVEDGTRLLQREQPEEAAKVLEEALGLWRGAALHDVHDVPAAQSEVLLLEELRLNAILQSNEAALGLGRAAELIPQLTVLTARHPFHERFHAQLMRALAGSGRRAEALATYQHARRILARELGVEPGPELRAVEAQILHGEA